MMPLEAIILAGGFGTRLQAAIGDVPKPMALVRDRPFLEYLLDDLKQQGISRIVLSVGYQRHLIMEHFGDHYQDIPVTYAVEEEPLGTGGGIRLAFWKIKSDRAVILNGDSLFRIDIQEMASFHREKEAVVTLALRKSEDTGRFGRVELDQEQRITGFAEKNIQAGAGYINGGIYTMEKKFLMDPAFRGKFSIEKDCFERMAGKTRMFGFPSAAYFIDIGVPQDYQRAQDEFKNIDH